jgi:hypothetical protein
MYSTASNFTNPVVRSSTALDIFERTRQDRTLSMYINHFRGNFDRMSDAHRAAFSELKQVDRFIRKLDKNRFVRFVELYDHKMDKNKPPYANMDEVMMAEPVVVVATTAMAEPVVATETTAEPVVVVPTTAMTSQKRADPPRRCDVR